MIQTMRFLLLSCVVTIAVASNCHNKLFGQMVPIIVPFDRPEPFNQINVCGGLWHSHKLCCDYPDLVQWRKNDVQNINHQSRYFGTLFKNIEEQASGPLKALMVELNDPNLNFFKNLHSNSIAREEDIRDCADHLKNIRNGALCSVCSGNFNYFMNKDKGAIRKGDCLVAVQKCWRVVIESSKVTNIFKILSSSLESIFKNNEDLATLKRNLDSRLDSHHLKILADFIEEKDKSDMLKIKMCEAFLSLVRPSIFYAMIPLLKFFAENLNGVLDELIIQKTEEPQQKKRALFLSRSISRFLNADLQPKSDHPELNLLASDVVVLNSDNMFTVDGSKGTTPDQTEFVKPMNLSLSFF